MTAIHPSSVSDALPWDFNLLSNLEMHVVFPKDEHHILKYEWDSILGSVSAF